MGIEIAQAYVQIVPSMKGVGKAIEAAFGSESEKQGILQGKKAGSGFANGLGATGAIIGAASAITSKAMNVIAGSIGNAVNRADQMNNFPKVMKNLGYSSDDAAASIKKISGALDGLPTTTSAMTNMVQQIAPLTGNLDTATDIALAFNNAMLAGGASTMEQENALAQYTQMLSSGKVDMQAWRSIQAAMPGQLNQVAEAMMGAGHNANDLYEAMKDGTYSFDDFNNAIMDLNQNGFAQYASFTQQAKDATQGIATAMDNVRNRVAKAVQKVIEAVGVENIAGAINGFSSQFGKIGDAAADMVTGVKNWLAQLYKELQNNGALTAFKSAWDTVRDAIMGVVNMVVDWVKMIPPDGLATTIKLVADALDWFVKHGPQLAPIIIAIGTAFAAVKGYQALNTGLQSLTKTMNAVTTGITGFKNGLLLIMDLGGPVAAIKEFASGMKIAQTAQAAWSAATKMATAVQGAFNAVMAINPFVLIIAAIAAVVAALTWFFTQTEIGRKAWSAFTTWLAQAWTAICETAQTVWNAIATFFTGLWTTITNGVQSAWNGITSFFTGLWQTISGGVTSAWTSITTFLSGLWTSISTTATTIFTGIRDFIVNVFTVLGALIVAPLQMIQTVISTVFNWILSFITQQMNSTNTVWSTIWTAIYNVVSTIFTMISGFISTVVNAIRTVIVVFLSLLKGDWSGAWDAIKSFFTTTWDGIKSFLTNILDAIKSVWETIWTAVSTFFTNIWNGIVSFFTPIINGIKTTIGNVLDAIKSVWTNIWNAISGVAQTVWNAISGVVSNAINRVSSIIGSVLNTIKSVWTNAWNAVSSFLSNAWNGMTNAVSNAVNSIGATVGRIWGIVTGALGNAGSWLYDTGKQIIQGLINGIGGAFGWLKDKITSLGSSVVNWAKGVLGIGSPSKVFRDQVGKWIPAGMAKGVTKNAGMVAKSVDKLTDMVPTVHIGTDLTDLDANLANGRIQTTQTIDGTLSQPDQPTTADIEQAIQDALANGISLRLNSKGGEVMAGILAKPLNRELALASRLGR